MRAFLPLLFATAVFADTTFDRQGAPTVKLAWARSALPPIRFVAAIQCDPLRMLKPFGIAFDGAGRMFVADPGLRAVLVHKIDAGATTTWRGNARYPLDGPVGVALAGDGRLFVTDAYRPQVMVFNTAGEVLTAFGSDVLKRPQGIAVDGVRGRVYVGDARLHQVVVFNARTLQKEKVIGSAAAAGKPDFFSMPAYLATNSKGNLYVADMWNCRIQVFGPDGEFVQRFPTECRRMGEYDRPHLLAIDRQDRIYFGDPNDGSIQVFLPDGRPLELATGLKLPGGPPFLRTGIAVDRNDRIYVAEQRPGEGRVLVFARGWNRQSSPRE